MDTNQETNEDKFGEALNAQRFQMLEDIAKELKGEIVFPTYFDADIRLRKELQDPDLPTARVASIVSLEPLIATKLMNLANSVLYNPQGVVVRNLPAAITRIGFNQVKAASLAVALSQMMRSKEMVGFGDLTRSLWVHSLKTAAAARLLASTYTKINPDEAQLAGLVHDLGAFYMIYRATQYAELRQRPETIKYLIVQWHESIGISLLNALGLPENIVEAAIDHDQPRPVPEVIRTLADTVYVANVLAGARFEWLLQDLNTEAANPKLIHELYGEQSPAIEAATMEMLSVFACAPLRAVLRRPAQTA